MISVHRFVCAAPDFPQQVEEVLALLQVRPGFIRGRLGRSTDDPHGWALITEWRDVGSYRRGLSGYEVKVGAWPLLSQAVPEPSAYELVLSSDGASVESSEPS